MSGSRLRCQCYTTLNRICFRLLTVRYVHYVDYVQVSTAID